MKKTLVLAPLLLLAGCSAPAQRGEEPTSKAEEPVSYTQTYWLNCASSGTCSGDIGSDVGRTCFLSGITGDIQGYRVFGTDVPSTAQVYDQGGEYYLQIYSPLSTTVIGAGAICIGTATNRVTAAWQEGTYATPIGGTVTANRRCFLSGIENTSGFTQYGDTTTVWKDSYGNWYLGGNQHSGASGWTFATCVDVPTQYGPWYGGWPNSGSLTGQNLAYNPGGVACGLTMLGGEFTFQDFSDGVWIDYNGGDRSWEWNFKDFKQATAICVQ